MPYQQVNREINKPYILFFELLKMSFFSIQQVNNKITPPLLSRLIYARQNIPYQQVNREKTPSYNLFEWMKINFFLNSTSQQQNHTTTSPKIYICKTEYAKSTSQQGKNTSYIIVFTLRKMIYSEFNKSTAKSHHPFTHD